MARYRSRPAVSQICALMAAVPSVTVRVENSTPMVVRLSCLNSFRVNRDSRLVFPTPDSPISTTAAGRDRAELGAAHREREQSPGKRGARPPGGGFQTPR